MAARLLFVAEPVLLLVCRLRAAATVADLSRLRERLSEVLLDFQASAQTQGIESRRVAQATEVLRVLIDHVVTSMPWGADAGWQSLAQTSASAGRPAQRLLDMARAASSDSELAELISVAVSLGFERRSRGAEDPSVDQLLALLAAPGQKLNPHAQQSLSPEGRSPVQRTAATGWLPLWTSTLIMAALLAALYFALQVSLGIKSDRIYARIAAMDIPQVTSVGQATSAPRLQPALSEQIAQGNFSVRDETDRSVIVVPAAKLFQGDAATLQSSATGVLQPIATVLQHTPGRIRVVGHTDGTVARSARFPSAWEFSVERARVVQEALRGLGIEASRLSYDGRANIEPLAGAQRTGSAAADSRIEIVLLVGR